MSRYRPVKNKQASLHRAVVLLSESSAHTASLTNRLVNISIALPTCYVHHILRRKNTTIGVFQLGVFQSEQCASYLQTAFTNNFCCMYFAKSTLLLSCSALSYVRTLNCSSYIHLYVCRCVQFVRCQFVVAERAIVNAYKLMKVEMSCTEKFSRQQS